MFSTREDFDALSHLSVKKWQQILIYRCQSENLGYVSMPKTSENWLGLVNSCVHYACQTHEIYQVLPYSLDFKVLPSSQELWNLLSKTVHSTRSFIWNMMTSSNGNIFLITGPLWLVNSPHKGQCRGALMFSLICVWTIGWANHLDALDLRCHCAHYDVTVMNK